MEPAGCIQLSMSADVQLFSVQAQRAKSIAVDFGKEEYETGVDMKRCVLHVQERVPHLVYISVHSMSLVALERPRGHGHW